MFYCIDCNTPLILRTPFSFAGTNFTMNDNGIFSITLGEIYDEDNLSILMRPSSRKITKIQFFCLNCKKEVETEHILVHCICGHKHPISEMFYSRLRIYKKECMERQEKEYGEREYTTTYKYFKNLESSLTPLEPRQPPTIEEETIERSKKLKLPEASLFDILNRGIKLA